jgi:uncharacterized repeat protein (TIGR01451 family)
VVGSYDPNIKVVDPESIQTPFVQQAGQLEYTVHFQNTGTAAATTVTIKDTLAAYLSPSTFEKVLSSHDCTWSISQSVLVVTFNNINLPDSTADEPNSHGFVSFLIRVDSTIAPGTTIHNTASIYFDFNAPVVTNDAVVTYCMPVVTEQSFNLCPGDSIVVGSNYYNQAGSYTDLLANTTGCDSTVITVIDVYAVDTGLVQNGAVLIATPGASAYQWYDCSNGESIVGANGSTFTPLQDGSYGVHLTFGNNCTSSSSCVNVTGVGIGKPDQSPIKVYPNPSSGTVNFEGQGLQGHLTIYNGVGQILYNTYVDELSITLTDLPTGLLTYKLVTLKGTVSTGKLLVQ